MPTYSLTDLQRSQRGGRPAEAAGTPKPECAALCLGGELVAQHPLSELMCSWRTLWLKTVASRYWRSYRRGHGLELWID